MKAEDRYGKKNTPTQWRDVPGYDGVYQVSWEGRVRSWRWRGSHLCQKPKDMTQYTRRGSRRVYVKLTDGNGRSKEVPVSRLMAEVWLGKCSDGKVVYHKNGDLADNCAGNLGFITPKALGRKTGAASRRMPVAKIAADGEVVEVYSSARAAAKANHMSYQTVLDRCHGKVKKPFALDGYTYRFDK